MKKKIFFIIMLMGFVLNAQADYSDVDDCFDYENSVERLACFDGNARGDYANLKLRGNRVKGYKGYGGWKISIIPDDIDKDRKIVTLSLKSQHVKPKEDSESATLYVRCKQDKTQVYVDWDALSGTEQEIDVRVSGKPYKQEKWTEIKDNDADGYVSEESEKLLVAMSRDKEANFVIRIKDIGDNNVKAVFDTLGLHKALIPIVKECSW